MSPPAGFRGLGRRFGPGLVTETMSQFLDRIGERLYLRLEPLQALLDPCSLGIFFRSRRLVHGQECCPACARPTRQRRLRSPLPRWALLPTSGLHRFDEFGGTGGARAQLADSRNMVGKWPGWESSPDAGRSVPRAPAA
jgi:hypothetical protein